MNITGAQSDPALHSTASAPARGRGRTLALRVLQAILIFMFAAGGLMKLGSAHSMVHMFGQIGAGQWFRYLIGSLELAGAVGLLIPARPGTADTGWPDRPPRQPGFEAETGSWYGSPAQHAIT
jgi:hypothetical protein